MKNGLEIDKGGIKRWYKNDLLHRENGPAIIWWDGIEWWYKNGYFHREDGPAMYFAFNEMSSKKYWYYEGEKINCSSQKEFLQIIKLKAFW